MLNVEGAPDTSSSSSSGAWVSPGFATVARDARRLSLDSVLGGVDGADTIYARGEESGRKGKGKVKEKEKKKKKKKTKEKTKWKKTKWKKQRDEDRREKGARSRASWSWLRS